MRPANWKPKSCKICGATFQPLSGRQLICSETCKKKYKVVMYTESNKRNKAIRRAERKLLTQTAVRWQNVQFSPLLDSLVMQSQTTWRDLFHVRDWVCSQSNQS